MDEEERQNGILAHVINPGVMKTNMQSTGADPKGVAKKIVELIKKKQQPAGKVIHLDKEPVELNI